MSLRMCIRSLPWECPEQRAAPGAAACDSPWGQELTAEPEDGGQVEDGEHTRPGRPGTESQWKSQRMGREVVGKWEWGEWGQLFKKPG